MPTRFPICWYCKHWHKDSVPPTCTAFPEKIPDKIFGGRNMHQEPVDGDHGIRFEQNPDKPWPFNP